MTQVKGASLALFLFPKLAYYELEIKGLQYDPWMSGGDIEISNLTKIDNSPATDRREDLEPTSEDSYARYMQFRTQGLPTIHASPGGPVVPAQAPLRRVCL